MVTRKAADRRAGYFHALCILQLVLCLSLFTAPAFARPEFLPIAKSAYNFKSGGNIDQASCGLCHVASGPPRRNPYGDEIKQAMRAAGSETLTAAILHSLDSKDADGDGFTNAEEFAADTLPGDPASHPAGQPKSAAPATSAAAPAAGGEINPFDIKAAIFAKHAQHPILIHFPIGLFIASLLFDILAFWRKNAVLANVGLYNLIFAAVSAVPAVITGLLAWQWQYAGAALVGNLRLHLILGITSCVLFFGLWFVRSKQTRPDAPIVNAAYLGLALVTAAIVALTGHLGGILSGVVTG